MMARNLILLAVEGKEVKVVTDGAERPLNEADLEAIARGHWVRFVNGPK